MIRYSFLGSPYIFIQTEENLILLQDKTLWSMSILISTLGFAG